MGRIRFVPVCRHSDDVLARHRAYSQSLGLPEIVPGQVGAAAPSLAVVGGSPDVVEYVDRLKSWDGDILAINQTYQWCRENGIDATFYRIDAAAPPDGYLDGVKRAVLADMVHPSVFDTLLAEGAEVELVRLGLEHVHPATTAAGTAPNFACWRGHKHVTLFGCGSSYQDGRTHVYRADSAPFVWVECGGEEYVTSPQMIMQAEWIAEAARAFPSYIEVAGGGFLPALIEHGDYSVTHACRNIHDALKEQSQ